MIKLIIIEKTEIDIILNRAKEYYENNKERLREQARNKYRKLSEYRRNRYRNMSIENKERLKEYQKIVAKLKKLA